MGDVPVLGVIPGCLASERVR